MTGDMPIVTRRDMLGETCIRCGKGNFHILWGRTNLDEIVSCKSCGYTTERWLTKREILKIRLQSEDNNNG